MTKVISFFAILLCLSSLYSKESVIEDSFIGKKLSEVTCKLGTKYEESFYTVNKEYKFISEIEPDYFTFFSEDEIANGVIICTRTWKRKNRIITVWARERKSDEWVIFSSVDYDKGVRF